MTPAPKLYTLEDVLSAIPTPSSGRKPGRRMILQRARELSACVDFGRSTYFTAQDINTILESFRPCSNLSDVKVKSSGQRVARSTASELSEAQNALEKAMQKPNAGGSKAQSGRRKVIPIKSR